MVCSLNFKLFDSFAGFFGLALCIIALFCIVCLVWRLFKHLFTYVVDWSEIYLVVDLVLLLVMMLVNDLTLFGVLWLLLAWFVLLFGCWLLYCWLFVETCLLCGDW